MTPDALMNTDELETVLPALEQLKMTDEAELVKPAALAELNRNLLLSWTSLKSQQIHKALRLAAALNAPEAIPAQWERTITREIRDEDARLQIIVLLAELKKDWARQLDAASLLCAISRRITI